VAVEDQLGRSFGVFREANGGQEVAFDPIFEGTTPLPDAGHTIRVRTYRPVHNIGHFRFVECGWLDAEGTPSGDITPFEDLLFPFDPALQDEAVSLDQVPVQRTRAPASTVEERYEVDAQGGHPGSRSATWTPATRGRPACTAPDLDVSADEGGASPVGDSKMTYCAYFGPDGNTHHSYCTRQPLAAAQADCDAQLKAKKIEGTCSCTDDASRPSEKSPTRCAGSFSVERPDRLRLSSVAYGQICSLFVEPFHEKSLRGSHGLLLRWPASFIGDRCG
jgi:hypothetical protein